MQDTAREQLYQRARNLPPWEDFILSSDEKKIIRASVGMTKKHIMDFRRELWGMPNGILHKLRETGHTVTWEYIEESVHWENQLWKYEDNLRLALGLYPLDRSTYEHVLVGSDCY